MQPGGLIYLCTQYERTVIPGQLVKLFGKSLAVEFHRDDLHFLTCDALVHFLKALRLARVHKS